MIRPLVLLFALSSLALADTYPRQPGVDALHYTFRLTLSDETDEIAGQTTVDLRLLKEAPAEVVIDLASTMKVSEVTSNGAPVSFAQRADRLHISLGETKAGERRQIVVMYRGKPAGGLRIVSNKFGERCFFSENWPDNAHQWLPMIDHPYDKATSEFIVTAPAKYQVIANGLLEEETDLGDGRRLTHWKQGVPISSWLNALGVARFAVHHAGTVKGVELQSWVYPQERAAGFSYFENTARRATEFFSDFIGPYSYEKLANVEAAGFNGGTEHASAIFYGENSIVKRGPGLIAHEVAHQWFGDAVTETDWDDVWLSEGFATYFTLLFAEHDRGRDAFVDGLKEARESVFKLQTELPGVAVIHENLADMKLVTNRLIYQKGAWTLHMLRTLLGDETFRAGIREYYRLYRDANASTEDFRRVMEETSGKELAWFFRQWLKRAGSPVVDGTWRYNAAAKQVEIELAQTQPGEVYRLPLEIAVASNIEHVELVERKQHFSVPVDKEPRTVSLDPLTDALMQSHFNRTN